MAEVVVILDFWSEQIQQFLNNKSRYFLASFEPTSSLVQVKKFKIDFQDGGHLWFPIGTI